MIKVDPKKYQKLLLDAALKCGIKEEVAAQVTDCMVLTDMLGIMTHGSVNLGKYVNKFKAGGLNDKTPEIIEEGPTWARIDGKDGFGMYNARYATDLAMKKAEQTSMAMVTVSNSGHSGASSNYTVYGARKGFLTIAMSNSIKLMCVPGGKGNVIGNSPISYAIPRENGKPVFMDVALSEVAKLKVVRLQKEGKPVPDGWVVDADGLPTNNPQGNDFSLCPMSAHKGYCMSFFVEVLTTVLSGGTFNVKSWLNASPEVPSGVSHAVIAVDIKKMMDSSIFASRLEEYIAEITGAPKAKGSDKIFYPGEPNWISYNKAEEEGLTLPDDVEKSVREFLDSCGIDLNSASI